MNSIDRRLIKKSMGVSRTDEQNFAGRKRNVLLAPTSEPESAKPFESLYQSHSRERERIRVIERSKVSYGSPALPLLPRASGNYRGEMNLNWSESIQLLLRMVLKGVVPALVVVIYLPDIVKKIGLIFANLPPIHIDWLGLGTAVTSGGIGLLPYVIGFVVIAGVIFFVGYQLSKPKPKSIWWRKGDPI